jgi:hypothetical protein
MVKPNSIEFEFDLLALDGDDAISNFKNLFGKKLKELSLNYEIFNLSDSKMRGGGAAIESGSSSTYPYNMFENFMDTMFKKKHDIKAEGATIYDMLFRDFKGRAEEDYTKKLFEITSLENGYHNDIANKSKQLLGEEDLPQNNVLTTETQQPPLNATVNPETNLLEPESILSSIEKGIIDMSDPVKVIDSKNVVESETDNNTLTVNKEGDVSDDGEDDDGEDDDDYGEESNTYFELSSKKINKIITLKLIVQYTDTLSLEGIKKG